MKVNVSKINTSNGELYFGMFLNYFIECATFEELLSNLKDIADNNNIKYSDIMVYGDSL